MPLGSSIPTGMKLNLVPGQISKVEFDPGILQHLQVSFPWREQLPAITCPILLVTGDPAASAIVTPQVAQEAASLWRQGEVIQIQGAGHCIHRDRYTETMPQIQEFLSRV